jgi:hypothetical protein
MFNKNFRVFVLALSLFLAVAAVAFSQGTTSNITGVVTDQSGAVVPDAAITITNQATEVSYNLTTNSAGIYRLTSAQPGSYTVRVAKKGFQTYEAPNNVVVVDQTLRLDATLWVGAETQTVTVEAAASLVSTEEGRVTNTVTGGIVQNMPLNGRDIYQLMQLIPGAVNSAQVDFENSAGGVQTNINGTRANFNGFLYDGVPNKGLSGGYNAQPAPDFVQEFSIQTNNFDAEYGNSAGSITNVATKSGTDSWHGDVWEFFRNDKLNARNFFSGPTKDEWRQNQFGFTFGGPLKKDKLFIFGGFEGERFVTASSSEFFTETDAWRKAVIAADPNSIAALLYGGFPGPSPTSGLETVDQVITSNVKNPAGDFGISPGIDYTGTGTNLLDAELAYLDPCFLNTFFGIGMPAFAGGPNWGNPQTAVNSIARVIGVTPAENAQISANIAAGCPGSGFTAPAAQAGTISRDTPMEGFTTATFKTQARGVFYNGNQFTVRGDYQGDTNRMYARYYWLKQTNSNSTPTVFSVRGFPAPETFSFPGAAYGWVHTFSATLVNEFRAGWVRDQLNLVPIPSQFGVPGASTDTAEPPFSPSGVPQFFAEDVFNLKDMVSIVKGKHAMKVGWEGRRNYENSEFSAGHPSYFFFDPLFFSADLPYLELGGVNPELATGLPSPLDTTIRADRNDEVGAFFNDGWKVRKNLTLNLGLRWDYFSPHTEKYNKATNFALPPGGIAALGTVNCQAFLNGKCLAPPGDTNTPNGGFTGVPSLFAPRYGNFGPRIGFAWEPLGKGKASIRGGAAITFESSFYNALSNSRWNLPYYSFNEVCPICRLPGLPVYGPTDINGNPTGAAPTFSGPPNNVGQGPASEDLAGNVLGWLPSNPNLAAVTGIANKNYRFPSYQSFFLGVQRQLSNSTVIEVNGVSTLGRHLFWAEDPNRVVGGKLRDPSTIINPCTGSAISSHTGRINPCFGHMRTWETSANSSYFGLQTNVTRRFSRGLAFTSAYTWSHAIDFRSTWHGTPGGTSTQANSTGAGGFSTDPNRLFLDKGNSLFDIRHRWISSVQWDLPWMKGQHGILGKIAGGWTTNWIIELQKGFPFTVGATKDYNKDGIRAQRPDTPSFGNSMSFSNFDFELGSGPNGGTRMQTIRGDFPAPVCAEVGSISCDGNLGRNTFRGPGIANIDFSLFKKIRLGSESRYLQFRAEFFNIFNRTNLNPPDANLTNGSFGLSLSALDPREIQFGLKLFF